MEYPTQKNSEDNIKVIQIRLRAEDYAALERLAAEQYRTAPLQASYLLARVLAEAGRTPAATAERILQHARKSNGE